MFFKLKMSPMVDAISMVCMFVASSIALEYGDSIFGAVFIVFVALFVELGLSMARAIELQDAIQLWSMRKKEAEHLQKEVDRLSRIISRQTLCHSGKKPLKRNKHKG